MGRKRRPSRRRPKANPRGIIEVNRAGFGFVRTAEGEFFIPRSGVGEAFDGDLVEVARKSGRRRAPRGHEDRAQRPEARVVRTLERAHETIVGTYEIAEPFGIVVPDDARIQHDVFTRIEDFPGIVDGSLVRVAIDEYPTRKSAATGHVIEVLGDARDALLSSERVIARNDIHTAFSEEAISEAQACEVAGQSAISEGYRDIRDRFVFTIDQKDAKDFDDALSVDEVDEYEGHSCRWRLGVHIADVSHYVPWGSAIDEEARKRATSVYLADRVVPMLPEALSDDICSLRPGEDRRCVTIDIYMDDKANMVGCDIYPALMRSNVRLSYEQALGILEGRHEAQSQLSDRLAAADAIAKAREDSRRRSGGLGFSTKEAKVRLDGEGHPVGVDIRKKDAATTLIEEAMVFANEVVARALQDGGLPCAYRVHEPPHADSLEGVVKVLREFKWLTNDLADRLLCGDPFAIQRILEEVERRPEEQLVTSLVLRAMTRAVYSPDNAGHYGLGLDAYCHFTSPIRRYPDLMVHRMLRSMIDGDCDPVRDMTSKLARLCEHCSQAERVAETAERESQELKMAEYLQDFIGQTFKGVISGVATYGIYVQLECTAEGLLPIRRLGSEYFMFDAARYLLQGSESGRVFRLGQPIEVVLSEVDIQAPALTFELADKKRRESPVHANDFLKPIGRNVII